MQSNLIFLRAFKFVWTLSPVWHGRSTMFVHCSRKAFIKFINPTHPTKHYWVTFGIQHCPLPAEIPWAESKWRSFSNMQESEAWDLIVATLSPPIKHTSNASQNHIMVWTQSKLQNISRSQNSFWMNSMLLYVNVKL